MCGLLLGLLLLPLDFGWCLRLPGANGLSAKSKSTGSGRGTAIIELVLIVLAVTAIAGCVSVPEPGDYVRIKDYNELDSYKVLRYDGRWLKVEDWTGHEFWITKYEIEEVIK